MITNLAAQGPPLSFYPASQRVTFLYYLGRFNFDHCDYWRAHLCLQEAYQQCPPRFLAHRRLIVTYWIPSNLMMGRFPTRGLLSRPEAGGLAEIYGPIRDAVRTGNFIGFQQAFAKGTDYLWARGIYIHLTNMKHFVWRSFTRKTFLITRDRSDDTSEASYLLDFHDVVTTATYVQKLLEGYVPARPPPRARPPHINSIFMKAVKNSAGDGEVDSLLVPPPGGPKKLMPLEGLIFGNMRPNVTNIENVLASLVYAGLMNGFVGRVQQKFLIEGTRKTGGDPLAAGWPNVYRTIEERFREDHERLLARFRETGDPGDNPEEIDKVPGWVRDPSGMS
jgi:nuclear mRNA export protein PCID2/THP1